MQSNAIIKVPSISFENFINLVNVNKIDLIKIDIEGAEILLFNSTSSKTLAKISQISIEFHDFIASLKMEKEVEGIIKRLEEDGFYQINFSRLNHYDVLFLNRRVYTYLDYIKIKYFARFYEIVKRKYFKMIN